MNYYFHCKRQCYLFGNKLNMEDNSEIVKVGKALHSEINNQNNSEIAVDNIKIDKLTDKYLVEFKKSDADEEATKWQTLYYLWVLRNKGIKRKGKVEYFEKNKRESKIRIYELDENIEVEIELYIEKIEELLASYKIPSVEKKPHCKKCAYYEYCFI